MARRNYSSRYSRSQRRRPASGRARRSYGGKRRARYTTKRRAGRAGVLAEVKFVNNIAGRAHPCTAWDAADIGPTGVAWRTQANETGAQNHLGPVKDFDVAAGNILSGTRYALTSKSYLLTHCIQGFEAHKRIGLAINPRSFLFRATVTAGRISQETGTKFGYGDGEVTGVTAITAAPQGGATVTTTNLLGMGQGMGPVDPATGQAPRTTSFCRTSLRIVIFRDMEPPLSGSATDEPRIWSDLFSTSAAGAGSTSDFLRTDNIGRFAVVTDTTVDLDADDPQKSIQLRVPISKTLRYGGQAANHIRAGHYFMVCCAEMLSMNGANPDVIYLPPVIGYQHRMAFTDS
jgi:hypothetical protein